MKSRRILPLLLLLSAIPVWANPKIVFIVKAVHPDGVIQVSPVLPTHLTLTGDTAGLQKGESLICEIVDETRKEDGKVVVDRHLKCNERNLRTKAIQFEVSQ